MASGVRLVMVSWPTYPALDPRRPVGLSPTVVQRELRQRPKFADVTITDALGAGALESFGGIPNGAMLTAGAGMDLLAVGGPDRERSNQRGQRARERAPHRQPTCPTSNPRRSG
jgi:beta-N-acetylhexosaminidase